ncbi:hypothetical protein GCM10009117_22130 [Gangjinia marincola]|uniref:Imelysin-like domain-containing protein n=1 Tax=Gangjinia marincola TaxID=578463 RepID=A0ABP3XYJ2_9FLAO
MKKIAFLLIGFILLNSCESDSTDTPQSDTFDRTELLINWADNIIIPYYQNVDVALSQLRTEAEDFTADPSINSLNNVRESWKAAYLIWQRTAMFEIGPAENNDLRLNLNTYPVNATTIEANINNQNVNLTLPSNRTAKGFGTIDYLLYNETTEDDIIAQFSTEDGSALRSAYLMQVIDDMQTLINLVKEQWQNSYRDEFVGNSGSSATASVDRFVNDYIFYYEKFLRAGKMGIPLGVFSGNKEPQTLEAFYEGTLAKELFLEGLDATRDFFNGEHVNETTSGESLYSYLQELNELKDGANLGDLINDQFDLAFTKVQELDTFKAEIEDNDVPNDMLGAYEEVQRLVPLFKVDMVSAMSINIDFVDADGD